MAWKETLNSGAGKDKKTAGQDELVDLARNVNHLSSLARSQELSSKQRGTLMNRWRLAIDKLKRAVMSRNG